MTALEPEPAASC